MYPTTDASQPEPFRAIKALLKHKTLIIWIATIGIALALSWVGYRTGIMEFYLLAVILGAVMYGVVRVAVDVVELVVQTLMPQ